MNTLTEYQNKCREMYKTGKFDMEYITKGFVDNELDCYKPKYPDGSFEGRLKIYLKYMLGDKYREKGKDARDTDRRMFERDNAGSFEHRRAVEMHNKTQLDILQGFHDDLPAEDLRRKGIIKSKIQEFENVMRSMPEYKEPDWKEETARRYEPVMAGDFLPKNIKWD